MDNFLKQIRDNWIILAFFVGLVIWYANTNSRLATVEAKQAEQESVADKVTQIAIDVAVIKTDVSYLKTKSK